MASSDPTTLPSQPQPSDFPASLAPIIYLPTSAHPTNVLIFLSGLGDTSPNFSSFARALNLPDTLTITLQPPFPLPFPVGPGFQWSNDLQFDQSTNSLDATDSPLTKSTTLIADVVISTTLIKRHKFRPSQIHLFGAGQGGSLALSIPLHPSLSLFQLGSVVTVGGALPLDIPLSSVTSKQRTPVLLLSGSRSILSSTTDQSAVKRIQAEYNSVESHRWKKAADSMPASREEVLPLMQFWGRRLGSRRGVPAGAVEVG